MSKGKWKKNLEQNELILTEEQNKVIPIEEKTELFLLSEKEHNWLGKIHLLANEKYAITKDELDNLINTIPSFKDLFERGHIKLI